MVLAFEGLDRAGVERVAGQATELAGPTDADRAWRTLVTGADPGDVAPPIPLTGQISQDGVELPPRLAQPWPGEPLWAGRDATVLWVPTTWPPPKEPGETKLIAPAPDLRLSQGRPTIMEVTARRVEGLFTQPLVRQGDAYYARFMGPSYPGTGVARHNLVFEVQRLEHAVSFDIDGVVHRAVAGTLSDWFTVSFPLIDPAATEGRVQLLVLEAGNDLRLIQGPLNPTPSDPWAPLSAPASFAVELEAATGPFPTVQEPHWTAAVQAGLMDCATFEAAVRSSFHERLAAVVVAAQDPGELLVFGSVAPRALTEAGCDVSVGDELAREAAQQLGGWRKDVVVVGLGAGAPAASEPTATTLGALLAP